MTANEYLLKLNFSKADEIVVDDSVSSVHVAANKLQLSTRQHRRAAVYNSVKVGNQMTYGHMVSGMVFVPKTSSPAELFLRNCVHKNVAD